MKYILQNEKSKYYETIDLIISKRKSEVFSFFKSEEISLPFNIYIYNTIEDLVNGLTERGFDKDPDYMCACHKDIDNSLNFFEPKDNPNDNEWSKEEYEKEYGIDTLNANHLWALEKNNKAISFYKRYGFELTNEKQFVDDTTEYLVHLKK